VSNLSLPLLILILIAFLLRFDFAFYIIYTMAGLWLLARLYSSKIRQALHHERIHHKHAFLGDELTVTLQISNHSWLPIPWLYLSDTVPVNLTGGEQIKHLVSLGRNESFQFHYTIACNRRGYYPLGPLILSSGDILGFNEIHLKTSEQDELIIYPKIYSIPALKIESLQPFGTLKSQQRIYQDPSRLAGIRDYQQGDPLRTIHWKASAHLQRIQVKKVDPAIALESMILLNLDQHAYRKSSWYSSSEWSISLAASLAFHLSQAGQAIGLACNGIDPLSPPDEHPQILPPRSGRQQLMHLLELLARIRCEPTATFTDWLHQAPLPLSWGATLLVITPTVNPSTLRSLHTFNKQGYNVHLFVTEPYNNFLAIQQQANYLHIHAYNTANEKDLLTQKQFTSSH